MEATVEMDKQRTRLRKRGPEESASDAGKGTSETEVIEEQIFKEYVESFGKEKGQMEVRGWYDELKEMRKTSLVSYEGVLWHTGCRRDKELEIEQNNDEEIKEQRFQSKLSKKPS
ncbi:unnamed protein product [Moneuplotes crassus]|uniref:Uncharacterized protein n=1 Tax=Euplotes crassus TaxID=5936 RepID=A0AAD1U0M0_EUPCR|nr:unnamed protein product [Moneuplotes crassus]